MIPFREQATYRMKIFSLHIEFVFSCVCMCVYFLCQNITGEIDEKNANN